MNVSINIHSDKAGNQVRLKKGWTFSVAIRSNRQGKLSGRPGGTADGGIRQGLRSKRTAQGAFTFCLQNGTRCVPNCAGPITGLTDRYTKMAPAAGFEPATKWLTATYSTAELCRSVMKCKFTSSFGFFKRGIVNFSENLCFFIFRLHFRTDMLYYQTESGCMKAGAFIAEIKPV